MKKIQINATDFDNAIQGDWDTQTCILAQSVMRNGLDQTSPDPIKALTDGVSDIINASPQAAAAMRMFDRHFDAPGDENKEPLQELRSTLPITVNLP